MWVKIGEKIREFLEKIWQKNVGENLGKIGKNKESTGKNWRKNLEDFGR